MSHAEYVNWQARHAIERSNQKLADDTMRARNRRRW